MAAVANGTLFSDEFTGAGRMTGIERPAIAGHYENGQQR
jgi:hypothetical protein